jgi:hypothetical protein
MRLTREFFSSDDVGAHARVTFQRFTRATRNLEYRQQHSISGQKVRETGDNWMLADCNGCHSGGGCEIRTHGCLATSPVFKTGALNRSANPPFRRLPGAAAKFNQTAKTGALDSTVIGSEEPGLERAYDRAWARAPVATTAGRQRGGAIAGGPSTLISIPGAPASRPDHVESDSSLFAVAMGLAWLNRTISIKTGWIDLALFRSSPLSHSTIA